MSFTDRMGFLPNNDGIAYDDMHFRNDRNRSSTGCGNFSLAGWDMINHMILGNRTLICAIQIIFIPTWRNLEGIN